MKRCKQGLRTLLCLAICCVVLCLSALPALAASRNVQETLDVLATLQNADINPAWQPDVTANMEAVKGLLTAYQKCSAAEKNEFTTAQNNDLKAYFRALYIAQGLPEGDAAKIVTGDGSGAAASSSSSSSSSSSASASIRTPSSSSQGAGGAAPGGVASSSSSSKAASSSAAASSTSSQSQSTTSASSSSSGPPAAAAATAPSSSSSQESSLVPPMAANQPQVPRGEGFFSVFASSAFGQMSLVVLAGLVALVVLRFLFALRSAGKAEAAPGDVDWPDGTAGRPDGAAGSPDESAGRTLPVNAAAAIEAGAIHSQFTARQEEAAAQQLAADAPEGEPGTEPGEEPGMTFAQRRAEKKENRRLVKEERLRQKKLARGELEMPLSSPTGPEGEEVPWPAPSGRGDFPEMNTLIDLFADDEKEKIIDLPVVPRDDRLGRPVIDEPIVPLGAEPHPLIDEPVIPAGDEAPGGEAEKPEAERPARGARTGRPPRMRFRQGDADDIDAIDD